MSNAQANHDSSLLRLSLRSNAAFSIVSGIAFVVAAKPMSEAFGIGYPAILTVIGISLLGFAAGLLWNASRPSINRKEAWAAVALDIGWVLGSAAVLALGVLSVAGNWAVVAVADIVLIFAMLQFMGLRRASSPQ